MKARYVRLFTDQQGASHFQDLDIELSSTQFAPSAPPLFLSSPISADRVSFFGAPSGWHSDWHSSSGRHLFAVMSGEWEITTSDGEIRTLSTGDVVLVEDTSGKGHASRVISGDHSLAVMVKLGD